MPSTYAHYSFGSKVLTRLPHDIKSIINNNRTAYNIGIHGPDLLFYYKPLSNNNVNEIGTNMHNSTAYHFFDLARVYISLKKDDSIKAYIFGFICHFILDSSCHRYINEKICASNISHAEVETSFDGILMKQDNINHMKWNPTNHIIPDYELSEKIACLFPHITPKILYECLKSMKFINTIITCSTNIKRRFLIFLLKITKNYEGFGGYIMKELPNMNCEDSNIRLYELYKDAIEEAVDLIIEYNSKIETSERLNDRFNFDYE